MAAFAAGPALAQVVAPEPARRPALVLDMNSGAVVSAVNAQMPWHPASLTKMMTVYVALHAMREGRLQRDSLLTVSPLAARQSPSKMGFRPGTQVTLEAALYILMVKSANDVSVTVAEGVSGSVPAFVDEMNAASRRLGMTGSVWRNPHGLHSAEQVTTARDMAVLARALYREFPQYNGLFRAQAIQWGRATMRNFNALIGRYPGADGMKTGFVCASGFNLVATASRGGQRLLAVVLGEQSARGRAERAAMLLERGFSGGGGEGFFGIGARPSLGSLSRAPATVSSAPNLRQEICVERRGRRGAPSESEDIDVPTNAPPLAMASDGNPADMILFGGMRPSLPPTGRDPSLTPATRPSLIAGIQPQVTAVVLGRSTASRSPNQPMRVGIVGTALVGRGIAPPAAAMNPVAIAGTPVRAPATTQIARPAAPVAAPAAVQTTTPASAPVPAAVQTAAPAPRVIAPTAAPVAASVTGSPMSLVPQPVARPETPAAAAAAAVAGPQPAARAPGAIVPRARATPASNGQQPARPGAIPRS